MNKTFMLAALSILSLSGLSLVSTGRAETVLTDSTPSAISALLKGAGYTAKVDKTGKNPLLKFKSGSYGLSMEFVDCVGSLCPTIYVSSGFDFKDGLDMIKVNTWNSENFTQVYLDKENDPFIGSVYYTTGGFTKTNFLTWLKEYLRELEDFDKTVE
jgi:Putative bacterial sensory transduction regulator